MTSTVQVLDDPTSARQLAAFVGSRPLQGRSD
jgi:hypothetical protein